MDIRHLIKTKAVTVEVGLFHTKSFIALGEDIQYVFIGTYILYNCGYLEILINMTHAWILTSKQYIDSWTIRLFIVKINS